MNEDDIDLKVKDFSNYLLDIGLLIGGTIYNEFGKKFKEINEKEKIILEDSEPDENYDLTHFKDNISQTMIKFYDSMNEEKKKMITSNIFNKYNKKKEEKNSGSNFKIDKNELLAISEENEEKIEEKNNKKDLEYKQEHFEITLLSSKNNLILKLSDITESSNDDSSKERFDNYINKKKKKKGKKKNKEVSKKKKIKKKNYS